MNKCVFKASEGFGTRVFYFRYSEPEQGVFDYETVWIYKDAELKDLVMGCHVSKIVILDNDVTIDSYLSQYLSESSFNKIKEQWNS